MTVDEVVTQALWSLSQFGRKWPTSHSVMYHEVGTLQQKYFSLAAQVNPEYFLAQAVGTLNSAKAIDLDALVAPLAECESVVRVVIENPGASTYTAGADVRVITSMEQNALRTPPRMRVNGRVLQQVGTDLANVTSIRVFYSERPPAYDETSGGETVSMPEPWTNLLVNGLAIFLCESTLDLDGPSREKALASLRDAQKEYEAGFTAHLLNFVPATSYRSRRQPPRP